MRNNSSGASRFELVTAAHHFLLRFLPIRDVESRAALSWFAETLQPFDLAPADLDAVLLRCLAVLDRHTGGRLPSLIERYLAAGATSIGAMTQFTAVVEDVLRYRGIGSPLVQQAIAIIDAGYANSGLTQGAVAQRLGIAPTMLCRLIRRQTGTTFGKYLREVRLGRAASLLTSSSQTIKEIWVQVGYNHPSNFAHDFRRQFGMAPREYRALAIQSADPSARGTPPADDPSPSHQPLSPLTKVLIVDNDETTRATVAQYLRMHGHAVFVAASGDEAIRAAPRLSPDVVLLDYRLGDMDGLDCLRRLRRHRPFAPPAVALFTADWDVYQRSDEVSSLHAVIVSKLCDLDQLGHVVDTLSADVALFAHTTAVESTAHGYATGG
jgi:AraC-like DNA-binding protein